MSTILDSTLLTIVLTALVTGLGTYVTTRRTLEVQYDANLRELRIGAYAKLWRYLGAISKYGRVATIDRAGVKELNHALTRWYYDEGGIFLSDPTRREYFALQDALEMVARGERDPTPPTDDFLVVLGSRLRSALTRDIGSRKTFMLASAGAPLHVRRGRTTFAADATPSETIEVSRQRRPTLGGLRRGLRWVSAAFVAERYRVRGPEGAMRAWRWREDRSGFTNDGDGQACTRVMFLEGDRLVEGPTGWSRLAPRGDEFDATAWTAEDR